MRMLHRLGVVVSTLVSLAACSGEQLSPSTRCGAVTGGGSGGSWQGTVVASITSTGGSPSFDASAEFLRGGGVFVSGDAGEGACQCPQSVGVADPVAAANAGTITIAGPDCTSVLATLVPSPVDVTGSFDLGANYSVSGKVQPWTPGEILQVSATGYADQVHAFAAPLPTGTFPSGVRPAIGPSPTPISLSHDFVVTWTPDGQAGSRVQLVLSGLGSPDAPGFCECDAPDSAGRMTVTFTTPAPNPPSSGAIELTRSVTTTVLTESASVGLVSLSTLSGSVTFGD